MKTSELIGTALDWAVAKCEGGSAWAPDDADGSWSAMSGYAPSFMWSQGGPIIEREKISIIDVDGYDFWKAEKLDQNAKVVTGYGPTPLIAAMRCYVASTLGDEVEIPEGLL